MYKEIKPAIGLNNLIDTFWTFSNNEPCKGFKILPDTCTDLIFDLNQNKGFISGIMSKYQFRDLDIESDIIGIRFKTEKFASFSKIPMNETKNLRVELSQIFSSKNINTLNQINDLESTTDKIDFLQNFITKSFSQSQYTQDEMVISVAQNIRLLNGIVNVSALADSYHISLRHLERRFKSCVGLTMKEFSNVVRFNNARKAVATFTKKSLLEIAFDFGFFDHAHMNYEFKRISGENPSSFR